MSGERPSSRELHATSTLASDSSEGSFAQGPVEETSARVVAAANLLFEFVCTLQVLACPRDFACHLCVAD